jgi:hypothetical protein
VSSQICGNGPLLVLFGPVALGVVETEASALSRLPDAEFRDGFHGAVQKIAMTPRKLLAAASIVALANQLSGTKLTNNSTASPVLT